MFVFKLNLVQGENKRWRSVIGHFMLVSKLIGLRIMRRNLMGTSAEAGNSRVKHRTKTCDLKEQFNILNKG